MMPFFVHLQIPKVRMAQSSAENYMILFLGMTHSLLCVMICLNFIYLYLMFTYYLPAVELPVIVARPHSVAFILEMLLDTPYTIDA